MSDGKPIRDHFNLSPYSGIAFSRAKGHSMERPLIGRFVLVIEDKPLIALDI